MRCFEKKNRRQELRKTEEKNLKRKKNSTFSHKATQREKTFIKYIIWYLTRYIPSSHKRRRREQRE